MERGLLGPELRLSDDVTSLWLLRDGAAVALLVLPIAALVALAAMLIGATARIYDQRESLIAFIRSDTQAILVAAQRRELLLPTLILGGGAALAGSIAARRSGW